MIRSSINYLQNEIQISNFAFGNQLISKCQRKNFELLQKTESFSYIFLGHGKWTCKRNHKNRTC